MGAVLVVDVGSSTVRVSLVRDDASLVATERASVPTTTPSPGFVEWDPVAVADAVLAGSRRLCASPPASASPIVGVAVTAQRASTVVWERTTGRPVAPGIGWQDLRTVGTCLALGAKGIPMAPNESAPKLAALLRSAEAAGLPLDDLAFGTVETWVAWVLSEGASHVTDWTNLAMTGLADPDRAGWKDEVLETLGIPEEVLPHLVDSSGPAGVATALPGRPPILALVGDQQASLVGQSATLPGLAKATFGTGAMLDCCVGAARPNFPRRGGAGTFPVVAWTRDGRRTWGIEAVMLSAGDVVEWLWRDLGLVSSPGATDELARSCTTPPGLAFVPALSGLGTPAWDFGARGLLVGLTRATTRAQIVRATLEGIAHGAADLLEAAEADAELSVRSLRVDGGMTANETFLDLLAAAIGRPVEVSPVLEATTLGAGYLAGLELGWWRDEGELASLWSPRRILEPAGALDRDRWADARARAARTEPLLSELSF